MSITYTTTPILCHGDSNGSIIVNVIGGTPPISYGIIVNGTYVPNNGNIFDSLPPGSYQISIRDDNGCRKIVSIAIDTTPIDQFNISIDSISCFNLNDGSIVINPNTSNPINSYPYQYSLDSNYQSSNTFTNLGEGYIVYMY